MLGKNSKKQRLVIYTLYGATERDLFMKHKRLNRDGWGFQYYPYYQIRIDDELFHGLVCLIRLTDGEANYWETPKAGKIQVTGAGMTWMELIPDNTNRVITVKYFPDGMHAYFHAGKHIRYIWFLTNPPSRRQ